MNLMRVRVTIEVSGNDGVGGARAESDSACEWNEIDARLETQLREASERLSTLLSSLGDEIQGGLQVVQNEKSILFGVP